MSIQIKKEYNNGLFIVQEIYDDAGFKILETTTNMLWNNSEEEPITIAKSRRGDYVETTEPVDPKPEEPIEVADKEQPEQK